MTYRQPRLYSVLWTLQTRLERLLLRGSMPGLSRWLYRLRMHLFPHDFLTGVYNRVVFAGRVTQALADGKTGALLMVDVDNFKYANDTWGHVEGDALLQHIVGMLRETTAGRLLGRIGGDEFGVYTELASEAADLAERIRSRVERDRKLEGMRVLVPKRLNPNPLEQGYYGSLLTVTIGIAHAKPRQTFNELLAAADEVLHEAKHAGRNRVVAGKH
jgi:diguanylate cyclase (GGDEF)-like protein